MSYKIQSEEYKEEQAKFVAEVERLRDEEGLTIQGACEKLGHHFTHYYKWRSALGVATVSKRSSFVRVVRPSLVTRLGLAVRTGEHGRLIAACPICGSEQQGRDPKELNQAVGRHYRTQHSEVDRTMDKRGNGTTVAPAPLPVTRADARFLAPETLRAIECPHCRETLVLRAEGEIEVFTKFKQSNEQQQ